MAMKTSRTSGPFDEAKTRALATQNSQTMIELQVQHARIKSEMMQVLTADQKTKLQQLEAEHQANMRSHMQMTRSGAGFRLRPRTHTISCKLSPSPGGASGYNIPRPVFF